MRQGLLLTSNKDIRILEGDRSLTAIACFYPIKQLHASIKMEYLFDSYLSDIDYNLVGDIASNWYKSECGKDATGKSRMPIGETLQSHLLIELSNALRYYFSLNACLKKYDKILVSENTPRSLKIALKPFLKKIDFFPGDTYEPHITASPNTKVEPPPVHKYFSMLLRSLQSVFARDLLNKVLVINDWTYRKVENAECLNINKFNLWRTFCLASGKTFFKHVSSKFPHELNQERIADRVSQLLEKYDFDNKVKTDLEHICTRVISQKYIESRNNLVRIYCSYWEMFEHYSPSMVVVPGYAHPFYQTIYSIAKLKNVPTLMVQDGYSFYFDKYNFPRSKDGEHQTFDYCATMGGSVDTVYKSVFRDIRTRTIRISPPIIATHKTTSQKGGNENVIVMFPHGMLYTPTCMWDQRYKYVLDVIKVLDSLHISKIQIKIKEGENPDKSLEIELMKSLMPRHSDLSIEFISGKLSEHLYNAKFIVGYLGTAIAESIYAKTPYYIYEPKILGMSDNFIHDATILDNRQVLRNTEDLRLAISNNRPVKLDKQDMFDGIDMRDIDYLHIIDNFQKEN